jgi:phosphoserine phosphatase RsbU/P
MGSTLWQDNHVRMARVALAVLSACAARGVMHLQENMLLAMAGSAILTIGLLSLCAHFASSLSRERILLSFGLFASAYGVGLICRGMFLPERNDEAGMIILAAGRIIGLCSSIPAILLFREFYGAGWRLATRWLLWGYALSLFVLIALVVVNKRLELTESPGITLIVLAPIELIAGWLAGYKPPEIKYRPVILLGLLLFFLTFTYDHLSHLETGHRGTLTEPLGFLALTLCLGFVISRRVATNEAEWRSMESEMEAARKIQSSILPASMPRVAGFSVAARYSPMTAVAGDYYSFPETGPERMGVIVADVMGHGVPAALVASMIKVSVVASVDRHEHPSEIIHELNRTLCKEAPGQLATAVYVSINRGAGIGRYTAAGHPPPLLWRRAAHTLEPLAAAGLLLGIRSEESFSDQEFRFSAGDRLLLYSDGLTEAENSAGVSFGDARLPHLIRDGQSLTSEQLASSLLDEVLGWSSRGSERAQADDITFVVIDLQ